MVTALIAHRTMVTVMAAGIMGIITNTVASLAETKDYEYDKG